MAKTFTAPFAQTPKTATAVCTAAMTSTATTAPVNTVELLTAGADGCVVTSLIAMPRATVTASSLILFLSKDSGATKFIVDSELMPATTVSNTSVISETRFNNVSPTAPMRLEAGDKLYVGSMVAAASGIIFSAQYTDF